METLHRPDVATPWVPTLDDDSPAQADRLLVELEQLTRDQAERIAAALAVARVDPAYRSAEVAVALDLRTDCAAGVEEAMNSMVARIGAALPD